jgi:serine/threonine-protein kinase
MTTSSPPSRPAPPYGPGDIIGDYKIEQLLGRGGMGFVYGAVNTLIGKRAAIKVLARHVAGGDMVERFITEARAVNQIGHPNIVDIFGFGTTDAGDKYMVMEWLRGESLADRMERSMSQPEICDLLLTMVSALTAAHAADIVHRDLKPENVFLHDGGGPAPVVKLLDFGIAKLLAPGDGHVERTQTGFLMGTPAYMSPEQARGKDVDHRSDIYSLGVIAFELFAGAQPFVHDTAMDLVVAHLHEPPRVPSAVRPGLAPAIDALVLQMLAKPAAARPTLAEIRAALLELRGARDTVGPLPPRAVVEGTAATVATGEIAPKPGARAVSTIGLAVGQTSVPPTGAAPRRTRGWWLGGIGLAAAAAVVSFVVVTQGRGGAAGPVVPATAGPVVPATMGGAAALVPPPAVAIPTIAPAVVPGGVVGGVPATVPGAVIEPNTGAVIEPNTGGATPATTRPAHRGHPTHASVPVPAPAAVPAAVPAPVPAAAPAPVPAPVPAPAPAPAAVPVPVAPTPAPHPHPPADRDGTVDPFAH